MIPIIPKRRKRKAMSEPTADVIVVNLVGQILQAKEKLADNPDERVNKMADHALALVIGDQDLISRLLVQVLTNSQNQRQPNPFLQQLLEKKAAPVAPKPDANPEMMAIAKQLMEKLKENEGGSGTIATETDQPAGKPAATSVVGL